MQAIAPVILSLSGSGTLDVCTVATRESWPVVAALGIPAARLDDAAFASDPQACMRALLDSTGAELVLLGSSPARGPSPETPEQFLILEARQRGVPSLSVQDYWGMYAERFSRDGRSLARDLLPDRLCVLDRRALSDLEAFGVDRNRMAITHNPWLDQVAAQAANGGAPRRQPGLTMLLASQPLDAMRHVRNWPYDQYTLFRHLVAALPPTPAGHPPAMVRILPHPSEDVARWRAVLSQPLPGHVVAELCLDRTSETLREVDYLVTSHSTMAYEALYFGTPCLSLRPTNEPVPSLWIEEAGLSVGFRGAQELREFLVSHDPAAERQRILQLKRDLVAAGLFFCDGRATERVAAEVHRLLAAGHGVRAQGLQ